jgi:hypothetical protein
MAGRRARAVAADGGRVAACGKPLPNGRGSVSCTRPNHRLLEHESQPELNLARRQDCSGDAAESSIPNVTPGSAKTTPTRALRDSTTGGRRRSRGTSSSGSRFRCDEVERIPSFRRLRCLWCMDDPIFSDSSPLTKYAIPQQGIEGLCNTATLLLDSGVEIRRVQGVLKASAHHHDTDLQPAPPHDCRERLGKR